VLAGDSPLRPEDRRAASRIRPPCGGFLFSGHVLRTSFWGSMIALTVYIKGRRVIALYFSGRRESAIFVGLWAPTILNLGQSLIDED
jgi:hypothetical protein